MNRRTRWVIGITCAVLALVVLGLFWLVRPPPPAAPIVWRLQPDCFPLGTVVQGSRVEMSLGLFSRLKPAPMPAVLARLPKPLRKVAESSVQRVRAWSVQMGLHVRVEASASIKVERTEVAVHPAGGAYAMVSFRLKTDSPGESGDKLVVHLSGGAYGVTNITVPVSATVRAPAAATPRAVLITETPYDCFSTEDGKAFEPLAGLNRRLAERGVRVDYCRRLPGSLRGYQTLLLGGAELARLGPKQTERLKQFVAGGGRLVLAPNSFFVPTVPRANSLLTSYGLQVVDKDAAWTVTNSLVIPDALTSGVKAVDFHRPSAITVTDPLQAKLLVTSADGQSGFVAVSRQGTRGEVVVLTQSLWWSWIRSDPGTSENVKLLEQVLER